jgi:hypothetical protein
MPFLSGHKKGPEGKARNNACPKKTPGPPMAAAFSFPAIGIDQADSQSRPASRNSMKQQKWLRLGFRTLRLRYFTIRSITASSKLRMGEAEPREGILFLAGAAFWDRSIVLSSFQSALCLV